MDFVVYPGDHISYSCGTHSHHGIYCGDISYKNKLYKNVVIHFQGKHKGGKIRGISYKKFTKGQKINIVQYQAVSYYDPDEVVRRAISKLDKSGYDLFSNNCEHFANWCKTGRKVSGQVNDVIARVGGMGGGILTGVTVAALLPLAIPDLIFLGICGYAAYTGGKFTSGLFTDSTDYKSA